MARQRQCIFISPNFPCLYNVNQTLVLDNAKEGDIPGGCRACEVVIIERASIQPQKEGLQRMTSSRPNVGRREELLETRKMRREMNLETKGSGLSFAHRHSSSLPPNHEQISIRPLQLLPLSIHYLHALLCFLVACTTPRPQNDNKGYA